ncbi:MAG: STAS domain-containing protein [Planctomycetota bacterium]
MQDSATSNPVVFGRSVDVSRVRDLREELVARLAEATDVSFDASAVERVDAAALQLLCAFVRKMETAGHTVQWVNPSDAFVYSARLLNVDPILNL